MNKKKDFDEFDYCDSNTIILEKTIKEHKRLIRALLEHINELPNYLDNEVKRLLNE